MLNPLLMPLWLGQLLTQEKSFEGNPVIGSRRLNERGLHVARLKLAHRLAARRRRRLARLICDEDRARLDRDGFVVKHDFLPKAVFAELTAQVRRLRAPAREMIEGDTITRRIALDPRVLRDVPAARLLLGSPDYRRLIHYGGAAAAAPMLYIETILTEAVEGPADPQTMIHSDTFHPTVKAWLYVNDAAEDLPFLYVPGSHRLTARRIDWERRMSLDAAGSANPQDRQGSFRIAPEELAGLGLPPIEAAQGTANTLVVADTFGFHARAAGTKPTTRVALWAFGRRNPFLPWAGLDPWAAQALGLRKPALYWGLLDIGERLGLARQRWRPAGVVSPFDPPAPMPALQQRIKLARPLARA